MTTGLTWETSPAAWGAFAAVTVAGVAAAWHYARGGGFGVAGILRLAAVLLLALTALRPTVRYAMATSVARPLRLVVDDSLSMSTADVRSSSEWLRVAEALGQFKPPAVRPLREAERARTAINALRQAEQRFAAAKLTGMEAAEQARLGAARQSVIAAVQTLGDISDESAAAVAAVEQALNDGTDAATVAGRLEAAWPTLRRSSDAADENLVGSDDDSAAAVDRLNGTSRYALALDAVASLRAFGASRVVTLDGTALDSTRTAPLQPATPLSAALRDACARAAANGEEAVVLLSDGRSTETRSLLPQAAATGVPVYTVAVAPEDRSPDVRVTRLDVPAVVLAGQDIPVRIRLSQRNVNKRAVRVVLSDGRRQATLDVPDGGDVTVSTTWPAAATKRLDLTARATPVNGERQTANNALSASVAVLDRRVRVRLVSGTPSSRDTEELAEIASAVPWIDLHRDGPPDFAADVILLADVGPEIMTDTAWADLRRAVRERGAALLVLAGRGDWLRDASTATRLAPLLPTSSGPQPAWVTPPKMAWPVPTRAGETVPYLRAGEAADDPMGLWLGRPKLSRVLSVGAPTPRARTLLVERETALPVLVESAVGGGRSVAVLVDEVWRWSTKETPDASRQFWVGLLQSMTELPYEKSGDGLEMAIDRLEPTAGRTFLIRLRAVDPAAGAVSVIVTKSGAMVATPPVRESLPSGGRFLAPVNVPSGVYDVTVRQGGRSLTMAVTVADDEPAERLDLSPDLGHLKRIADATGGQMIPLEDLGRLPDVLALRRDREPRVGTFALWSSPWWFLTIVGCLGLEWAVRPRAGLA